MFIILIILLLSQEHPSVVHRSEHIFVLMAPRRSGRPLAIAQRDVLSPTEVRRLRELVTPSSASPPVKRSVAAGRGTDSQRILEEFARSITAETKAVSSASSSSESSSGGGGDTSASANDNTPATGGDVHKAEVVSAVAATDNGGSIAMLTTAMLEVARRLGISAVDDDAAATVEDETTTDRADERLAPSRSNGWVQGHSRLFSYLNRPTTLHVISRKWSVLPMPLMLFLLMVLILRVMVWRY